jgi:hypothetical protein
MGIGSRRMNNLQMLCTHVNGKMRPETTPGMGSKGMQENNGESEFKYHVLKELLKMPQCTPSTTIIFKNLNYNFFI